MRRATPPQGGRLLRVLLVRLGPLPAEAGGELSSRMREAAYTTEPRHSAKRAKAGGRTRTRTLDPLIKSLIFLQGCQWAELA